MHYLLVTEPDSGYFEHEVIHDEDCSKVGWETDLDCQWEEWDCNIGKHISWYGWVDIEDDLRFKTPGKYPIDFYSKWSGSMFDDSEVYIYFVEQHA